MGESVKIIDLARKMISLAGMSVSENGLSGDIKIEFTGLRPGEKLYEELLIGDNVTGTDHHGGARGQTLSAAATGRSRYLHPRRLCRLSLADDPHAGLGNTALWRLLGCWRIGV